MSTENILLNSPALKSLKRAQLVGLCKRCGLRANGKNTELIARLQEYGRSGGTVDVLGDRDDTNRLGYRAESVAETNDGDGNDKEASELQSSTRPTFVSRAWPVGEPMGVEANIPGAPSVIHEFGDGDVESKKCKFCILYTTRTFGNLPHFPSLKRQLFVQITCCFSLWGVICTIQSQYSPFCS